eukprot:6200176-Pleurochrysis_carterae.AAC.1
MAVERAMRQKYGDCGRLKSREGVAVERSRRLQSRCRRCAEPCAMGRSAVATKVDEYFLTSVHLRSYFTGNGGRVQKERGFADCRIRRA